MVSKHIIGEAETFIRDHFKVHIPQEYVYHNYGHTLDIVEECRIIGTGSGMSDDQLTALHLGALFHDSGYKKDGVGHENHSIVIFKQWVEKLGYPQEQIEVVSGCIAATKIPQMPKNKVEQIMCDADLAYLGQETFMHRSNLLRQEWKVTRGQEFGDRDWFELQVRFLTGHVFHTDFAKQNYGIKKLDNLEGVRRILNGMNGQHR